MFLRGLAELRLTIHWLYHITTDGAVHETPCTKHGESQRRRPIRHGAIVSWFDASVSHAVAPQSVKIHPCPITAALNEPIGLQLRPCPPRERAGVRSNTAPAIFLRAALSHARTDPASPKCAPFAGLEVDALIEQSCKRHGCCDMRLHSYAPARRCTQDRLIDRGLAPVKPKQTPLHFM
jgi:hypothetical protein